MPVILSAEGLAKSFLLNGEPRLIISGLDLKVRDGVFLSIVEAAAAVRGLCWVAGWHHPPGQRKNHVAWRRYHR